MSPVTLGYPKIPRVESSSKTMSSEKGDKLNLHAFAIKEGIKEAGPHQDPHTALHQPQGGGDVESFLVGAGINILACSPVGITGFWRKNWGPFPSFL